MNVVVGLLAFVIFAVLWAAFAYALLTDRARLDAAWARFRAWPLVVQAVVALLLLPVVIGLWVYRAGWPLALRLVLIAALGVWTLYMFLPTAVLAG